jgi:hypothetical protein
MKDIIRINELAGTITESQAKRMMDILNENTHSIYSDALDTYIKNGDILKLKDGTQVRVGAIPAKENPKYKTGMVLASDLSTNARGPMTIDINNDVEEVL